MHQSSPSFRARSGSPSRAASLCLCVASIAASCAEKTRTFEAPRDVTVASDDSRVGASNEERFGLRTPSAPHSMPKSEDASAGADLEWTTPPGWRELPPKTMRTANFRVAGDMRAECYLTLLAGDAGGLAANVNRWRTQMSLPPLSSDEIASLERIDFMGQSAAVLDVTGTWTGMSQGERKDGYRLLGLLAVTPGGSAFLKMTGPGAVIDGEIDAFHALAKSFRRRGETAPAAQHLPPSDGTVPEHESRGSAAGLQWQAPQGWQRAPDRATRVASYAIDAGLDLECYITVLAGDAGGLSANVNRWRKQLGLAEQAESELATEAITMLGTTARFVELASEDAKTLILGALCFTPERSVFVKLHGPSERVAPQREAFRAFSRSIESSP